MYITIHDIRYKSKLHNKYTLPFTYIRNSIDSTTTHIHSYLSLYVMCVVYVRICIPTNPEERKERKERKEQRPHRLLELCHETRDPEIPNPNPATGNTN